MQTKQLSFDNSAIHLTFHINPYYDSPQDRLFWIFSYNALYLTFLLQKVLFHVPIILYILKLS